MSADRATTQASRAAKKVTSAYRRSRQQIHEVAKFLIVGGAGLAIVLIGSDALHFGLGVGEFTAVTIATVVATVANFVGNRYWSFRHRHGSGARSETIVFFILNGVGLLIQFACISLFSDVLGLSGRLWYTTANLAGVGIGTMFRFWSYRKWIWVPPEVHLARLSRGRHRKSRPDPGEALPSQHRPAQARPAP